MQITEFFKGGAPGYVENKRKTKDQSGTWNHCSSGCAGQPYLPGSIPEHSSAFFQQ